MKRQVKIFLMILLFFIIIFLSLFAWGLFMPKQIPNNYVLKIRQGHGWSVVSRQLANDRVIYWRIPLTLAGRWITKDTPLKPGHYRFSGKVSAWDMIQHLYHDGPEKISVRLGEGWTIDKIREHINQNEFLEHKTKHLTNHELLAEIDIDKVGGSLEGRLFPDTYLMDEGTDDITLYRTAYSMMNKNLNSVWNKRDVGLPYENPYEMLIMASIIEKETNAAEDRPLVAAVFVNRLKIGMRLQTDPTVIYGMGKAYNGNITKADLQRDTPYNTYTRKGFPPTPIASPSMASLQAAAHPADVDYLYFVGKGNGRSHFSSNLTDHNAAVRRYILKIEP